MRVSGFALALLVAAAGCGRGTDREGRVLVFAAASTREALQEAADEFGARTGVAVKISPGPSDGLARQIEEGAPADLFLSASVEWADEIAGKGLQAGRKDFLSNRLVLVVPRGNPAGVRAPADLLGRGVSRVALAGERVPAGAYAGEALRKLGLYQELVDRKKIVRGQDVRGTLAYVEQGEAEAGVVYATDARVSAKVEAVHAFDARTHPPIVYTLTLLREGEGKQGARQFYDYLLSPEGLKPFEERGFLRTGRRAAGQGRSPTGQPLANGGVFVYPARRGG